jgi:hypothetical protein
MQYGATGGRRSYQKLVKLETQDQSPGRNLFAKGHEERMAAIYRVDSRLRGNDRREKAERKIESDAPPIKQHDWSPHLTIAQ